jgi:hypothetical protein
MATPELHPQITVKSVSANSNLSDYESVLGSDYVSVSGSGFTPNGRVAINLTDQKGTSFQRLTYGSTDAAGNLPMTMVTPTMSGQSVHAGSYGILVIDDATGSQSNMVNVEVAGAHALRIHAKD